MPTDPLSSPDTTRQSTTGYCTNIHPGTTVAEICENLKGVSAAVAQRRNQSIGKESPLPIGLWLPSEATVELRRHGMQPLIDALSDHNLQAYTINGFPYDNFHQEKVKRSVYEPAWWHDERLGYTRDLAKILSELLPEDVNLGSISTLPLGWPKRLVDGQWEDIDEEQSHHAGTNLRRMAEDLRMLEDRCGKRIVLAIEPEPGCLIDRASDMVAWYEKELPDPTHRRYIGVCHDICHSAVMMEDQTAVLRQYADAGIVLGKVQVSSAIVVPWQNIDASKREEVIGALRSMAEDRYLHQVGRVDARGNFELIDDLPDLLDRYVSGPAEYQADVKWVVHFHVPIFAKQLGLLSTSHDEVLECLAAIKSLTAMEDEEKCLKFTGHYEVETYAWSVIPEEQRTGDLAIESGMSQSQAMARDIAHELQWFENLS